MLDSGHLAAWKCVIELVKHYHLGIQDNNGNQRLPDNLPELMAIIGNRKWYKQDLNKTRKVIYCIFYRIFREGHNKWALEAADQWMGKHKLVYSSEHQSKKGFAYTLTTQKASNTLVKHMQDTMQQQFGEQMMVRQRLTEKGLIYETGSVG